jgi:hypothetical protein
MEQETTTSSHSAYTELLKYVPGGLLNIVYTPQYEGLTFRKTKLQMSSSPGA